MGIAALIGIMVAIVVAVSLIGSLPEAVEEGAANGLVGIIAVVVASVILTGVASWIGFSGGDTSGITSPIRRWMARRPNPKSLREYFSALQIYIREDVSGFDKVFGLKYESVEGSDDNPLMLHNGNILTVSKNLEWFLVEKSSKYAMYKLVGIHKEHRNLNSIYIIGKDSYTNIPFLYRLPPSFLYSNLGDCIRWCMEAGKLDDIKEV